MTQLPQQIFKSYQLFDGIIKMKIVTTGHSLGGALSQLVHINLWEKFNKTEWCPQVGITNIYSL